MHWKPEPANSTAAQTTFARLQARRVLSWSYAARVFALDGRVLAEKDDFPTLETAQAWAESEYARLLRDELAALD